MKPVLVKLVDAILKHLEEHPESTPTEQGIRKWLNQQGYAKRDIDCAIRLLKPCFGKNRPSVNHEPPVTTRPFTDIELNKLRPVARDILVRLEVYGLLEPFEREAILEKISSFEGTVGLEELEYLLSWLVFTVRDVETQQTFLRVIEQNDQQFN